MGVNLKELMSSLSPDYQAQIRAQLGQPTQAKVEPVKAAVKPVKSKMTKTEAEYESIVLQGKGARFEGITLRMANGHKYTPDFVYWEDGQIVCVEVKGSYRLGSYQRARLAYDQAKVEYSAIRFYWVEKNKDGDWKERS